MKTPKEIGHEMVLSLTSYWLSKSEDGEQFVETGDTEIKAYLAGAATMLLMCGYAQKTITESLDVASDELKEIIEGSKGDFPLKFSIKDK